MLPDPLAYFPETGPVLIIVGTSPWLPLCHLEIHLAVVIAVYVQGHCLCAASPVMVKCP